MDYNVQSKKITTSGGASRGMALSRSGADCIKCVTAGGALIGIALRDQLTQNEQIEFNGQSGRFKALFKGDSVTISPGDRCISDTDGKFIKATDKATVTTSGAAATNKNTFTAVQKGKEGNELTVAYIDPGGTSATLSFEVDGKYVKVNLGRASSAINTTSGDITTLLMADAQFKEILSCANAGDGLGLVTAGVYQLTGAGWDDSNSIVYDGPTDIDADDVLADALVPLFIA